MPSDARLNQTAAPILCAGIDLGLTPRPSATHHITIDARTLPCYGRFTPFPFLPETDMMSRGLPSFDEMHISAALASAGASDSSLPTTSVVLRRLMRGVPAFLV